MQISNIKNYKQIRNFGAAKVSISALSDTHGNLKDANKALEEMRSRQHDIFYPESKGNYNVFAVCGDWFMDGAKKGFLSDPNKPLARFQSDILNEFYNQIKKIAHNTLTLFTPGNHEFDGGVPLLDHILSDINAEVLMTNLDINNSEGFSKSISDNKIINQKILEIEDDKNPKLKHKILFLGVSPVNMPAYQNKLDGIVMPDEINKIQASVEPDDYKKTLETCIETVQKFKEENPNGLVILFSHTGVDFADNLAKKSKIDFVFDGHEHKNNMRMVNGTPIISLSQNFKKIANAKFIFNDEGKLVNMGLKSLFPLKNETQGPLSSLYKQLFEKDLSGKYLIEAENNNIDCLDIQNIRLANSYLANFITDCVLEQLKKTHPEVNFFALNSSSIRNSLNTKNAQSNSHMDLSNVLAGLREDEAQVMLTEVSGEMLTYMVLDNYLFNQENPEHNTIIHYSGLITDKTNMLKAYSFEADVKELSKYIIDASTNQPIDINKKYIIANPEKYFDKNHNPKIKELKNKSSCTGLTVHELLQKRFDEANGKLKAKCDIRIK